LMKRWRNQKPKTIQKQVNALFNVSFISIASPPPLKGKFPPVLPNPEEGRENLNFIFFFFSSFTCDRAKCWLGWTGGRSHRRKRSRRFSRWSWRLQRNLRLSSGFVPPGRLPPPFKKEKNKKKNDSGFKNHTFVLHCSYIKLVLSLNIFFILF
jgi:hypothetical protein